MALKLPAGVLEFGPAAARVIPTDHDKAYAAGFFDGEGNIAICANKNGGARGTYLVYNMRIGACQNDPEPLFWLRDRWGGTVRRIKRSSPHRAHEWQAFSRGALIFLHDVMPYLIVKTARATLAIEYQSRIEQRGRGGRTPEYVAWAASVKSRMNLLNAHPKNVHIS